MTEQAPKSDGSTVGREARRREAIERGRAETALRDSEARYRVLIEQASDGVWIADRDGRFLNVNPAACAMLGYTREQYAALSVVDIVRGADRGRLAALMRAMAEGERVTDVWQLRRANGTLLTIELSHALTPDGCWQAIGRDIGGRLRAEAALRESEARYRTLVDAMTEGYGICELIRDDAGRAVDWRFLEVSPGFEAQTGMNAHFWVGRRCGELFPDQERGDWLEVYAAAVDTRAPRMFEGYWAALDRWFAGAATPLSGQRFNIAFNDVSERKRAEIALRESEKRKALLLDLSDALRSLNDAASIERVATDMLGKAMGADHVFCATIDSDGESWSIAHDYTDEMPSLVGHHPFSGYQRKRMAQWQAGVSSSISDSESDPSLSADDRAAYAAFGARAAIGIPLVREGRFAALLVINQASPRDWTDAELTLVREVAERAWTAIERARAETALRASEQRLRTLADTAPALIWFNDQDGKNTFVNRAFVDYTGCTPEQIAGKGWHDLVDPQQEERYVARYLAAVREQRPWHHRSRMRRADGMWRWFDNHARPLLVPDGGFVGHVGVSVDIDDVVQAEQALHASEEQQRLMLELVPALLWQADPTGAEVTVADRWAAYTGQPADAANDFGWLDAIHPDDVSATRDAFAHAFATGEPIERQQRVRKAGDGYRWHLVRHVPVRDAHGAIVRWFGAAIDVDELHELQISQQTLVAELQHRVRNVLAVVRSIMRRTLDGAQSLNDYAQHLDGRMDALARTQVLLTRQADARVMLEDLVRDELLAQAADETRITLTGVDVELSPQAAEVVGLVVHELATNAVKYGAFSHPDAALAIGWTIERRGREQWFVFVWRETGVPIGTEPARRTGFGTELITRRVPYELKGTGTLEMRPGGVVCIVAFPLRARASAIETGRTSSSMERPA